MKKFAVLSPIFLLLMSCSSSNENILFEVVTADKTVALSSQEDSPTCNVHLELSYATESNGHKADIINNIAEKTGLPKKDISTTVEAFMSEIRTCMAEQKESVFLRGFGTFTIKHRAKKTARNISKNTTLVIDEHDIPAFKPAKSFIEKMK